MELCWMSSSIIEIWISPAEFKDVRLNKVQDDSIELTIQLQAQNCIYYSKCSYLLQNLIDTWNFDTQLHLLNDSLYFSGYFN